MQTKKWKYSSQNQTYKKTSHYGVKNHKKSSFDFQIKRTKGFKIYDASHQSYLDFNLNEGALLAGHAHPKITRNLKNAISKGYVFPKTSHLKYKFKKELLQYYPLMKDIFFYSSKVEVLMNLFYFIEKLKFKNSLAKTSSPSKILFIGREFYLFYSELIQKYPFIENYLTKYAYFLPYLDIKKVRGFLEKDSTNSKMSQFKNWFFSKKEKKQKNHSHIDAIIFSPMHTENHFSSLQTKEYEELRSLAKEYQVLLVLDQSFYTLRIGLRGFHPSYFMEADIYLLSPAIAGGFDLFGIAFRKDIFHNLKENDKSFKKDMLSNEYKSINFHPLAYVAGIINLKNITYENPYNNLKNLAQQMSNETKNFSVKIEAHESMFYLRQSKDIMSESENKVYTWLQFKEIQRKRFVSLYHPLFTFFMKNFILMNPQYPFLGFLSVENTKTNVKPFMKALERLN